MNTTEMSRERGRRPNTPENESTRGRNSLRPATTNVQPQRKAWALKLLDTIVLYAEVTTEHPGQRTEGPHSGEQKTPQTTKDQKSRTGEKIRTNKRENSRSYSYFYPKIHILRHRREGTPC